MNSHGHHPSCECRMTAQQRVYLHYLNEGLEARLPRERARHFAGCMSETLEGRLRLLRYTMEDLRDQLIKMGARAQHRFSRGR